MMCGTSAFFLQFAGDGTALRTVLLVEASLLDDDELVHRAQEGDHDAFRELDDDELVRRAQGGDHGAFGELVRRHERAMFAIARAYFASEADAEDAVQTAFLQAFRSLGDLRDGRKFASWAARITTRECHNILRTRPDRVSLAEFSTSVRLLPRVGQEDLTPASMSSQNEDADRVKATMGHLSEPHRVVLLLRYTLDMKYKQIAAYLDVPLSTVRSRLAKAKVAFRRALKKLFGLED